MIKKCCFAGHSKIYNTEEIYDRLIRLIKKLIIEENVSEFLVGNYGAFDKLSAKAVQNLKEIYSDIRLNLVIPYLTADINKNKDYYEAYDNIIIADIPESTPDKFKILKCNENIVKSSDFIICHITHNWGGAFKTFEYAKKQKRIIIFNL